MKFTSIFLQRVKKTMLWIDIRHLFYSKHCTNFVNMNRIEREKRVVARMVQLYCRHKLGLAELPDEYRELVGYAHVRLGRCKFGEDKPACKRCPVHCYKPAMREKIRAVMRWAGPRMIFYDPVAAIRHLLGR